VKDVSDRNQRYLSDICLEQFIGWQYHSQKHRIGKQVVEVNTMIMLNMKNFMGY
jgi:hypothetical protein